MSINMADSSYEHVEATDQHTTLQPLKLTAVTNSATERLLLEAQKESGKSSRISSVVGSPKFETGTTSPTLSNDMNQQDLEWVWNWSSRPEVHPMSNDRSTFKHPATRRRALSIRNTRLMTRISTVMEFLPYVVLSHTCSFVFGASLMAFYLRKVDKVPALLPSR